MFTNPFRQRRQPDSRGRNRPEAGSADGGPVEQDDNDYDNDDEDAGSESSLWGRLGRKLFDSTPDGGAGTAANAAGKNGVPGVPVLWLLGKTGSGKSSIIAALTGSEHAAVGEGFRPCTRHSRLYDFPASSPVLQFLDTRGLGEPDYDPAEDIARCEATSHALLVITGVDDPDRSSVVRLVRQVRKRRRDWPVIVVETQLHRMLTGGADCHPRPDPFTGGAEDLENPAIPQPLREALRTSRNEFSGLPGSGSVQFVPLDFTKPTDGFTEPHYGRERLVGALENAAPEAAALRALDEDARRRGAVNRDAAVIIRAYAFKAGSGAMIPVVGTGSMLAICAAMISALATHYGISINRKQYAALAGSLGIGALLPFGLKFGLRELVKLTPAALLAAPINGAAAFAFTWALGRAACAYFDQIQSGQPVDKAAIRAAFRNAVKEAPRRKSQAPVRKRWFGRPSADPPNPDHAA